MSNVRMYVTKGCPHCDGAKQFLESKKVSVEFVEIGFDPILQAGIRAISNGQGLTVPIIISFLTQEVLVGNDQVQLQRLVDSINSTGSSNPSS